MKVLKIIELGGDYVAREIIERSKNKDIIYLTEDIILNTKCVQQLSEYIENLIARNKELESALKNSVSKDEIKAKIEELNDGIKRDMINYDKIEDKNWKLAIHRSMTQKIETKKVLQELLNKGE